MSRIEVGLDPFGRRAVSVTESWSTTEDRDGRVKKGHRSVSGNGSGHLSIRVVRSSDEFLVKTDVGEVGGWYEW